MRKIITVLIAISLIISFTGCRDDISKPVPDMDGITTYAELFDTWWWKMNSNYVYWSVDSPGSEWDEVYEKYMPVFQSYDEECGSIESSSVEIQKAAARDYMDIVKNLHDGHYTLSLRFPDVSVSLSPGLYALLCRSDINPERAEDIILNGSVSTDPETADKAFIRERLPGIAEHIFKLPIPTGSTPVTAPFSAKTVADGNLRQYFTEAGYFMTPPDHKTGNENTGNFVLVAGITHDNILYLGFSNFLFQIFEWRGLTSAMNKYRHSDRNHDEHNDHPYTARSIFRMETDLTTQGGIHSLSSLAITVPLRCLTNRLRFLLTEDRSPARR